MRLDYLKVPWIPSYLICVKYVSNVDIEVYHSVLFGTEELIPTALWLLMAHSQIFLQQIAFSSSELPFQSYAHFPGKTCKPALVEVWVQWLGFLVSIETTLGYIPFPPFLSGSVKWLLQSHCTSLFLVFKIFLSLFYIYLS